jgi:two-component system sensor histidine kinase GlrK
MERSAAQYLVLRDPVLAASYQEQSQQILHLTQTLMADSQDLKLQNLLQAYCQNITTLIEKTMQEAKLKSATDSTIIKPLQSQFNVLTNVYEQIFQRSNELNSLHITNIKQAAQATRDIMIRSLVIIPISILIAGIFIFLITSPLKVLAQNRLQLQRGKFDQEIKVTGAPEIQEIVQALESMRTRLQALELQKSSFIRHRSHE